MQPLAPFLDGGHVGKDQLGVDDFDVAHGVDAPGDVVDVVILKAAHHLHDGVDLADVAQELVAEPLPLARAAHQPRDVHKLDHRRDQFLGMGNFRERGQPGIGHNDDPLVGVDGAERIVRRLRLARPCDGVKKSGFTHVGEPDNACA